MKTLYCPTCRIKFKVWHNPPHAVIHLSKDEHIHPITRVRLLDSQLIKE